MKKLLGAVSFVLTALLSIVIFMVIVIGGVTGASWGDDYCLPDGGTMTSRVPEPMNSIFSSAAQYYKVPAYAVALVYFVENRGYREPPPPYGEGGPYTPSYVGAQGPMQFMPLTWWRYRNSNPLHQPGDVMDLTDAVFATANMLSQDGKIDTSSPFGSADDMYREGTVVYALAVYNAGSPGNFNNSQTREYVRLAEQEYRAYFDGEPNPSGDGQCDNPPVGNPTDGYPNTENLPCLGDTTEVGVAKTAKDNVIKLCEKNGIIVNASVSARFSLLVDLVAQQGYTISGSGFRTMESQIALRKINCGTSHYAIWEMPSMECRPPTAIPGTSQHEQGLAVDLVGYQYGNGIFNATRRAAADPRVMFANNVPTEPWHWAAIDIGNDSTSRALIQDSSWQDSSYLVKNEPALEQTTRRSIQLSSALPRGINIF